MSEPDPTGFPIHVTESAGFGRLHEPLRIGVPLPRGAACDPAALRIEDESGTALPLQARPLAIWSDGSIKWLLVDTQVTVGAGARQCLRLKSGQAGASAPMLRITEGPASIEVDTGAAKFRVPRGGDCALVSVQVAGREQLAAPGLRVICRDGGERALSWRIDAVHIEEQGPLRTAIVLDGRIEGTDRRLPVQLRARLVFCAGSAVLEAGIRIRNPRPARHRGGLWDLGDPGSQLLRELALEFAPARLPQRLHWSTGPSDEPRSVNPGTGWVLYQDSSGGERWNSPNHLVADGQSGVSFRGYQLRDAAGGILASGERATPCLELVDEATAIACSVEDFWQNFPKALRYRDGRVQLALFPAETRAPTELQGGEQKTHCLWLAFGAAGEAGGAIRRRQSPLAVTFDPLAVEATRAIHGFAAPRADDDPRYAGYVATLVEGTSSLHAGREHIDEYGWRNFGDVYADHEAVRHDGPGPFITHYNNQYDVVQALLQQGLRSADPRWFPLARDLARHVIDIDIYHTDADRAAFNGGLFWHSDHYLPAGLATHRTYSRVNAAGGGYGGGPSNEQNYTTGLLNFHYLTGDAGAAEAVRTLADFVLAMDDGSRTLFAVLDDSATGLASKTVSSDFHGPGRGAGNSINALLDAYALTRERHYLRKAEELIERCIHPADDIDALGLAEPEHRWSYLVFLQVLGKYLTVKLELGETGYEFCHARDSLLHYARWMLEHEQHYKDVLHKVLLPTETWPAQDIRKAIVLYTAAAWCIEEGQRARLAARAREFEIRCLTDLLEFPTAQLVRPRVLLAVNPVTAARHAGSMPMSTTAPNILPCLPRRAFATQRQRMLPAFKARLATSLKELARLLPFGR